jgi:hypothetical protein
VRAKAEHDLKVCQKLQHYGKSSSRFVNVNTGKGSRHPECLPNRRYAIFRHFNLYKTKTCDPSDEYTTKDHKEHQRELSKWIKPTVSSDSSTLLGSEFSVAKHPNQARLCHCGVLRVHIFKAAATIRRIKVRVIKIASDAT